jgi:hypothetical protein
MTTVSQLVMTEDGCMDAADVELQRSPNIDEDEQLDDWDTARRG